MRTSWVTTMRAPSSVFERDTTVQFSQFTSVEFLSRAQQFSQPVQSVQSVQFSSVQFLNGAQQINGSVSQSVSQFSSVLEWGTTVQSDNSASSVQFSFERDTTVRSVALRTYFNYVPINFNDSSMFSVNFNYITMNFEYISMSSNGL